MWYLILATLSDFFSRFGIRTAVFIEHLLLLCVRDWNAKIKWMTTGFPCLLGVSRWLGNVFQNQSFSPLRCFCATSRLLDTRSPAAVLEGTIFSPLRRSWWVNLSAHFSEAVSILHKVGCSLRRALFVSLLGSPWKLGLPSLMIILVVVGV